MMIFCEVVSILLLCAGVCGAIFGEWGFAAAMYALSTGAVVWSLKIQMED